MATPSPESPERPQKENHPRGQASQHLQSPGNHRHGHGQEGPNAHYWLDPILRLQVVTRIEQEFTTLDPEYARLYTERAQYVRTDLEQLHAEITQKVLPNGC